MGRALEEELRARGLELEKAKAEIFELREQVAIAERSIWDSQFLRGALSPPHAQVRALPAVRRQVRPRR